MSEPIQANEILVVEDSHLIATILSEWIARLPWMGEKRAVVYHTAEEALGYLEAKTKLSSPLPILIILDLELPGQHGLEFLEKIKKRAEWKSIPVVVNSSSLKPEDIRGSYKKGGLMFMKKADDENLFRDIIQQLRTMGVLKGSGSFAD